MESNEYFRYRSKLVHNERYDYSNALYIGESKNIEIICKVHGAFWQTPHNHYAGKGCSKCARITRGRKQTNKAKENFVYIASNIHNNKYDYSKVKYIKSSIKVCIVCTEHGDFYKTPNKHISSKQGCPKCLSTESYKLEDLDNLYNGMIKEKRFNDLKDKKPLSYDRFLPSLNLLIEYDGEQHFRYKEFWHKNIIAFIQYKWRDHIKTEYAYTNKINLLRISYKENHIQEFNYMLDLVNDNIGSHVVKVYDKVYINGERVY